MATENNNKIEAVLVIAVLVCLTILTYQGKITGDAFEKLLGVLIGYVFGRVLNHKTGAEP